MTKEQLATGNKLAEAMTTLTPTLLQVRAAIDERTPVLSIALQGGDIDIDTLPDEAGQAMLGALYDVLAMRMDRLETEFTAL